MTQISRALSCAVVGAVVSAVLAGSALADPLAMADPRYRQAWIFDQAIRDQAVTDDQQDVIAIPARLQRQMVDYATREQAGTIVIDTPHTYLYLVLGGGKAVRYGIGVGRDGFTWSGVESIARKIEWPDWTPPADMLRRQPYLPRFMAGGPGNPLGARAMYLGNTVYRIHGTNQPSTIGGHVSSGCIRMTNEDVADLYDRVQVGAKVVVLPAGGNRTAETTAARPAAMPAPMPVAASSRVRAFGIY